MPEHSGLPGVQIGANERAVADKKAKRVAVLEASSRAPRRLLTIS